MNNEEKILEMLAELSKGQAEMRSDIADLKATQAQQGELLKELDERSLRSAVLLENEIAPKVQLLFEGQKHLRDTLAPKQRVEKVEEVVEQRVVVLESVVKSHSERLAKLEKAQ